MNDPNLSQSQHTRELDTMAVNTGKVSGRRNVRFETTNELLEEVQRLASDEPRMVGNWSLGQMLYHVAASFNMPVDKVSFKAPLFFKLMAPLVRKKFIYKGLPAGVKFPDDLRPVVEPPDDASTVAPQAALQKAVD